MKLIYCDKCYDVVPIRLEAWRTCQCGTVGGQYNSDCITATIGGIILKQPPDLGHTFPRVFGIANPFFYRKGWHDLTAEDRQAFRKAWDFKGEGDCWWGGYKGDNQLFYITNPDGPRVKVTWELIDAIKDLYLVILHKEGRTVEVAGRDNINRVIIPSVQLPSLKSIDDFAKQCSREEH